MPAAQLSSMHRWGARAVLRWLAACVLMAASLPGLAANSFVAIHEAALDEIFGVRNFGSTPIDIRFNARQTVVAPSLLVIDTDADFNGADQSLKFFAPPLDSMTIAVFFVDTITACGPMPTTIVGCGSFPGNLIAVQSAFALGGRGAFLLAHELGHNLNLDHIVDASNIMHASLEDGDDFNGDQVAIMVDSDLVQTANGQRFLSITPFAVVAAIPEPETWLMLGVGLIGVVGWARRRRACTG